MSDYLGALLRSAGSASPASAGAAPRRDAVSATGAGRPGRHGGSPRGDVAHLRGAPDGAGTFADGLAGPHGVGGAADPFDVHDGGTHDGVHGAAHDAMPDAVSAPLHDDAHAHVVSVSAASVSAAAPTPSDADRVAPRRPPDGFVPQWPGERRAPAAPAGPVPAGESGPSALPDVPSVPDLLQHPATHPAVRAALSWVTQALAAPAVQAPAPYPAAERRAGMSSAPEQQPRAGDATTPAMARATARVVLAATDGAPTTSAAATAESLDVVTVAAPAPAGRARRAQAVGSDASRRPSLRDPADERVEVHIGSIHVTVDAPPTARAATTAPPAAPPRRAATTARGGFGRLRLPRI